MTNLPLTSAVIEELVAAQCGANATLREKHVLREALTGLVRLAKVEYSMEARKALDEPLDASQALAA